MYPEITCDIQKCLYIEDFKTRQEVRALRVETYGDLVWDNDIHPSALLTSSKVHEVATPDSRWNVPLAYILKFKCPYREDYGDGTLDPWGRDRDDDQRRRFERSFGKSAPSTDCVHLKIWVKIMWIIILGCSEIIKSTSKILSSVASK